MFISSIRTTTYDPVYMWPQRKSKYVTFRDNNEEKRIIPDWNADEIGFSFHPCFYYCLVRIPVVLKTC